jgi:Ser/Thr protein kinase RdoA (MazF antagonist)
MEINNNNRITRENVLQSLNDDILQNMQSLWELEYYKRTIYPQYGGCQNLIYFLEKDDKEFVLRVSFRENRTLEQIQTETHFIDYLHSNGALVAYPIKSKKWFFC